MQVIVIVTHSSRAACQSHNLKALFCTFPWFLLYNITGVGTHTYLCHCTLTTIKYFNRVETFANFRMMKTLFLLTISRRAIKCLVGM